MHPAMPDKETAHYIVIYFSNLFNEQEKSALIQLQASESPMAEKLFRIKGLLTQDKAALDLIKDGYDAFEINTATRILKERTDGLFLNNCPICHKLARTPKARLCGHCGYSWHNMPL